MPNYSERCLQVFVCEHWKQQGPYTPCSELIQSFIHTISVCEINLCGLKLIFSYIKNQNDQRTGIFNLKKYEFGPYMCTPSRQGEQVGLTHSLKTREELHFQRLAMVNNMQGSPKFKHYTKSLVIF